MRPLIVFATHLEAAESLKATKAIARSDEFYSFDKGDILISGMGLELTEKTLARFIEKADRIVNLGIAGALREDIAIGSLHTIRFVSHESFEKITIQENGMRLLSVKNPLFDLKDRDLNSYHYDLVDMEGYAIAKLAQQYAKPCTFYKIVSDHCSNDGPSLIKQRLPALSKELVGITLDKCWNKTE